MGQTDHDSPATVCQGHGSTKRAEALDALRGAAILAMALSSLIPFGVLPVWMYHAQVPPPAHTFDPSLPGLTWVDLVFPFFLFSMGAAMPLALSRRIDQGDRWWQLTLYVLRRGLLIAAFAIYDQHIRPQVIDSEPTAKTWLVGLLGFVLLFPALARLPRAWPAPKRWTVRAMGWAGAVVFLAVIRYPEGSGFSLTRSDIILVVLANVALFGSALWLLSRTNLLLRIGFLGILMAVRLSHDSSGWVQQAWDYSPAPWIYKLYYLQYLFIVLPGTIVGDLLRSWAQTPAAGPGLDCEWSRRRLRVIVGLMIALHVLLLAGMQARWLPGTPIAAATLCVTGWWLFSRPAGAQAMLLRRLFGWGCFWLLLGLTFEPWEGGIKKDHPTVSYYFVTTGLAVFALIALIVVIEILGQKRPLRLLVENGRNPMIAYAGITNLLGPVLGLCCAETLLQALTPTPWLGVLGACAKTLLLAWLVSLCTRRRIFWRT
ncbi:MAG: DUF5009 domain-containing protein [bacterium]|nr:DUF5009 domain-containing protein [bacterium]